MSSVRASTLSVHGRSTQAERRARSRSALLESAARGLSRYGYSHLLLEEVAREAGYTRGALYHQFKDKEDLALAVIEWVNENWMREVGEPAAQQADPVAELLALARGHAIFCRRDIARVVMALRLEFAGQDHPVGRETERIWETGVKRCVKLINAGRKAGSIPPGPSARAMALALLGALEGAVIALAGHTPHDELLAAYAVAGVLGIDSHRAKETPYLPAIPPPQATLVRRKTTQKRFALSPTSSIARTAIGDSIA
jgi:AcrR family transcriptional regulator